MCNDQRVNIPWDGVGATIGDGISAGAVIQHLAKLRTRMIADDKAVPPPLRRGGHSTSSTGPITPKATPPKRPRTTARSVTAKATKPPKRKAKSMSNASEDDKDEDYDSSSEVEYGARTSKRSGDNEGGTRKIKKELSGDDVVTASQRNRYARSTTAPTPSKQGNLMLIDTNDEDTVSADNTSNGLDDDNTRYVAAGASFLTLENDVPDEDSGRFSRKTIAKKSMIVTLSMDFEAGLNLLNKYAKAKETLESSSSSEMDPNDDAKGDEDVDEECFDESGVPGVLGANDAEGEAIKVVGKESPPDSGNFGTRSQQHIFVDSYKNLPAAQASSARYPGLGFQLDDTQGDFPAAESETQVINYTANELNGYETPTMAFNQGFVQDAFFHDDRILGDDDWMQGSLPVASDNNAYSSHGFHDDFTGNSRYGQTNYAPQNPLLDNTNGYYPPNVVNGASSPGFSDRDPAFVPQFDASAGNGIPWLHNDPVQDNTDFKPTGNGGYSYNN